MFIMLRPQRRTISGAQPVGSPRLVMAFAAAATFSASLARDQPAVPADNRYNLSVDIQSVDEHRHHGNSKRPGGNASSIEVRFSVKGWPEGTIMAGFHQPSEVKAVDSTGADLSIVTTPRRRAVDGKANYLEPVQYSTLYNSQREMATLELVLELAGPARNAEWLSIETKFDVLLAPSERIEIIDSPAVWRPLTIDELAPWAPEYRVHKTHYQTTLFVRPIEIAGRIRAVAATRKDGTRTTLSSMGMINLEKRPEIMDDPGCPFALTWSWQEDPLEITTIELSVLEDAVAICVPIAIEKLPLR